MASQPQLREEDKGKPATDELRYRLGKKIRQQLISTCVCYPDKKEDEYIYVGDVVRKFGSLLIFWKRKKGLSTKEKLIGNLLK